MPGLRSIDEIRTKSWLKVEGMHEASPGTVNSLIFIYLYLSSHMVKKSKEFRRIVHGHEDDD